MTTTTSTTTIPPSQPPPPPAPLNPITTLDTSLNQIFLAVGDFLDFNSRTTSLGLESFSRKPQDEARRALESNLQKFQSACDALEIQIIRAKQVLRREIDAIQNPVKSPEPEKVEEEVAEVVVDAVPEEGQGMEEVKKEGEEEGSKVNEERGEKTEGGQEEEVVDMEEDTNDLFGGEFESLMDPDEFQGDMGFSDWMDM